MSWNLLDSGVAGFADGNGGHAYSFPGGAASAGNLLTLSVSSNTLVTTPSGWTKVQEDVGNIGAYQYMLIAAGGETGVTITTSGNEPTEMGYLRHSGNTATPLDVFAAARHTSGASATPAVTTATLATTGELVIAAACLANLGGATPTTPVWSTGYTNQLDGNTAGTGNSDQHLFVGTNANAGTAAESPSVSWTNATGNQTILVMTFKPQAGTTFDRTGTDAFTTSDSLASNATLTRATSDSSTTSDSPTRAVSLPRATPDAFTTSDSLARTVSLPRATPDSLTTSDSPTRTVSTARSTSDTFTTADSLASNAVITRGTPDTVTTSDVLTRAAITYTRTAADTVTITDVATDNNTGPARNLVVHFGKGPLPKWQFGTLQNSEGEVGTGVPVNQSILSTAYVQVPVAAFVTGVAVDPTSDTTQMAFVPVGESPGSGDWHTGSWDTAPDGSYLAQCLVGPGASGVALTRGIYATWVKIVDNPEIPVAQIGLLQIV